MQPPLLRLETPADGAAIHRLTAEAFRNAPHTSGTEAFIVDALRNAGALTLSLVAEDAGVLVGHVGLSPVTVADGSTGWYGLGPVSVLPSHQGRGIGSALVRDALARLRAMGASGCVLVGEPAYYGRFGFKADPRLVLAGVPPAYFQALAFNGAVARGEVKFHPGFEATAG
jgi:putative acetyltransferase